MKNIYRLIIAAAVLVGASSCEKFLDRPSADNYNTSTFYLNDTQCEQGVNYLYNSPWYDFQRGFIKIGEVMSGNMYWGSSPYLDFSTNATDEDLKNMSYSLWAVNGHCNAVITNILAANGPTKEGKNKAIGECLVWKAMAYFFMVRTFGEVPIVHDNSALLAGEYNTIQKVERADVYEYIIMNLEKAMELLPKTTSNFKDYERIDYYAAEALLAKVYLAKAGVSGSLDSEDLKKAAEYAEDVILHSGRSLLPSYEDIFRLSGFNKTGECLISWLWKSPWKNWTEQNSFQSDLGMVGFGDQGDLWGQWGGPSVDLMEAFGTSPLENPASRNNADIRRKATIMMAGDKYSYFWQDKGGFDYLKFLYDENYGKGGPGAGPGAGTCATGGNDVKHLYGNDYDHQLGCGTAASRMGSQLPTHILRLSDVYLIYAEAKLLGEGDAATAKDYVNQVRKRAGATELPSVGFEEIWKERRLELAHEGDRWYDYVRRSYYDMNACITELKAQKRSTYSGELNDVYKTYFENGSWDASSVSYLGNDDDPNVTETSFTLPFPAEDVVFNGNMAPDAVAVHVDVRSEYTYNF